MAPGHISGRFDKLRRTHAYAVYGRGPKRRGGGGGNGDGSDDQPSPPPLDEDAWRALVAQAVAAGRALRPARWTTILYSCAKLGRREPALVAAALRALSPEGGTATTTTAAEAAAAALSLAAAEARPGAGVGADVQKGGTKMAAEEDEGGGQPPPAPPPPPPPPLASLHGPALANLLWSLAAMGERPSDAWLAHFCAATAPAVFGPRRAARLLSRQQGGAGVDGASASEQQEQQQPPSPPPPPLNPHQHATMLWALGALQYRAPAPYVSALLSGMRSGGAGAGGGAGGVGASSASPSSSLRGLLPSELANACWASMLRLGFLPSARWRTALLDATYRLLLLPSVPVVAGVAAAAAEDDGEDDEEEEEADDCPPSRLTDHQLACLVWSWASVRARPPRRWLDRLALSLAPGPRRRRRRLQRPRWQSGRPGDDGGQGDGCDLGSPLRRPGRAATMPSRQLSVLLCGLAKMGAALPERAMDAVCWRVVALCSSSAGGGGGGGGLGGVGGVGGGNNNSAVVNSTAPSPSAPPLDDLAALCWALPRLARPDSREWGRTRAGAAALRALSAAALPRLPEARSARPLAQLLVGLAAGGYNPGVLWLKTHQNACAALSSSFGGGGGGGGADGSDDGSGMRRRGLDEDNRDRMRRALRALVMDT